MIVDYRGIKAITRLNYLFEIRETKNWLKIKLTKN